MIARRIIFAVTAALALSASPGVQASARSDLAFDSEHALEKLYRSEPFAKDIARSAKAIMVVLQ